ncbi:hypothetical protein KAJ87_01145 [Candidatus Pacearchaeota archaeon]|nr:hypothetical protein [Candidatus Pacearchaeota archaeon]
MKNVLILTYDEDPHADSVSKFFDKKGVEYFRVVTENLAKDYKITFESNDSLYKISNNEKKIYLDSSWNIWNRRVMNPDNKKNMPKSLIDIVVDESEKTWDGLLASHKGKVVNRPQNHFYANNKIDQLKFASGKIKIPDTIVTNDPSCVEEFYEKHKGNICFKLQKGTVIDEKFIYTNKVTKEQLKNVDLVSKHPCLFQEYVDKEFEVRVVATDKNITGIAIDSQNSEISKIDFRRYDFDNVKYEHINLPDNVKGFCSSLLKNYGLHFGALDFIYSKERGYVFLELNPNGQWLWLEETSGYNLTKEVAENLIN